MDQAKRLMALEQENIRFQMKADAVMEQLPEVSLERGTRASIRSDSSSEFTAATLMQDWCVAGHRNHG